MTMSKSLRAITCVVGAAALNVGCSGNGGGPVDASVEGGTGDASAERAWTDAAGTTDGADADASGDSARPVDGSLDGLGTPPDGGVCPRGTAYPDGCQKAPAGTPQYPSLLDAYGANRPPWNVAGVDYSVGLPAGTALTDWQAINDPSLSVDKMTGMIRCTGAGASVVLDKVDFSLHGGAYFYNGAGGCAAVTITNSNFACPTTAPSWLFVQDQNGASYLIEYDDFDGTSCWAANGPAGGFATFLGVGRVVLQYNRFRHSPQQTLDTGGNSTVDYRYNLLDDVAISPGAHMNYLQFGGGGTASSVNVAFNTSRQSSCGGAEGFQFYNNNTPATIVSPALANNTMIAIAPPAGSCAAPNSNVVMSYMIHGTGSSTTISGTATNHDNYFDERGAYGAYYPGSMTGWASSGNVNMVTGATVTPP